MVAFSGCELWPSQSSPPNQPFLHQIHVLCACTMLAQRPSSVVPWTPDLNPFAVVGQANELVQGVKEAVCVLRPGIIQRQKNTEGQIQASLHVSSSWHGSVCTSPPFQFLLLFAGFTLGPVINGSGRAGKRHKQRHLQTRCLSNRAITQAPRHRGE